MQMKNSVNNEDLISRELDILKERIEEMEKIIEEKNEKVQALEGKVQLYELSADGSNDGFWDLNLQTKECFVSKSWNKMMGYPEGDHFTEAPDWKKIIHPDDFDRIVDTLNGYLTGELSTYEVEYRLKHFDGSYRWLLTKGSLFYNEKGEPSRMAGSTTDITHKKEAAEEIKKSDQRYKNLFDNSLVGMFRVNFKKGLILEANKKALQMFKVESPTFPIAFDFFHDDEDRKKIFKALSFEGIIENYELQFRKSDESLFWASFSACVYEKEAYTECVLKDISETKENLLELQKVNFELDNFVYHASHDLRSPLRSVLGLVDILRIEQDEKERINVVDMIEGSIKRLDSLVKDLLSISRNNRVNDPYEDINFMLEINSSLSSVYHVQDIQNLEVITKISQPVSFYSDLTRIRIILNNLISNAIKYRSFEREKSFVDIEIEVNDKRVLIKIADNGEGIPDDKIASVFDMFVRASESSEGSGLGLYIVKNVLDKLNGKITMESTYNVGTTFKIMIPNGNKEDRLS